MIQPRFALILFIASALAAFFVSPVLAQDELFNIGSNGGDRAVSHYDVSTGTFLGWFASRGDAGISDFHWGGTFGPDGNLYVADYLGGSIAKFDGSSGAFLGYFVPPGGVGAPVHIHFASDGYLYVAENGPPQVSRFNGTTGEIDSIIVPGETPDLGFPQDLVFGADGKLYISTFGTNAVLRYDPNTHTTETFVQPGSGGLSSARQMAFGPDGNLYVTAQDNGTVKRYSSATGDYLGDFIEPGYIGANLALAFSPNGNYLYVSASIPQDPVNGGTARFDGHTGAFIDYFIIGDGSPNLVFNTGRTQVSKTDASGNPLPVAVSPLPTTSMTFSNITAPGQTVVTPLDSDSTPLPTNFQVATATGGLPTYFDISTTATFSGSVTLAINYDPAQFTYDPVNNPTGDKPVLLHYENGTWVDITTSIDTATSKVYGSTTSFSPFAIAKKHLFSWSGVLQPINADGSSVFKRGSTVPVKFKLTGADAAITNLNARLYIAQSDAVDPSATNEAVSTSSADTGNTFRYDATAGQYSFNLSTKNLLQGTWYLRIDLGDGTSNIVQIRLKK